MDNILFEDVRNRYIPSEIKVLFIGESPPIGGTFFFLGKSILFNATKDVFEEFYDKYFYNPLDFLDFFKNSGYFLDDLCYEPINHITDIEKRRKLREENIENLKSRLNKYNPLRIIVIMKDQHFNDCIDKAIRIANIDNNIKYNSLPFPRYNKAVLGYKSGLLEYLTDLKRLSII